MPSHPLHDPLILSAPPSISPVLLEEALRRDWGLEGALHPLGGERDRNFRLDREAAAPLLVKLAHPDEDPAITEFQNAALLHLEAADPDLPVPRVLPTPDGRRATSHPAADGRSCLLRVLTFLPGQPLPDRAGPGQAGALGRLAARLDRAFEGFSHPADGRRLLWDIREVPGLRALLPEVEDEALRALATEAIDRYEAEAAPRLAGLLAQVIHNDLNPHNVVVDLSSSGQPAGILDFGDMLRAPALQEVATACAYLVRTEGGEPPMAGPEAFLAGYAAVSPIPGDQAALLPAMMAARMALTVLVTSWRARRQPENAGYILRNQPGARAGLAALSRLAAITEA